MPRDRLDSLVVSVFVLIYFLRTICYHIYSVVFLPHNQLKALLKLYRNEKYILVVNQQKSELELFVSFKVQKKSIHVPHNCINLKPCY